MGNFSERLNALIKSLGISNYKFANNIGISQALISKLTSQPEVNFRADFFVKVLSKYPTVNTNWLLTGVGEMFHYTTSDNEKESTAKEYVYMLSDANHKHAKDIGLKLFGRHSDDFKALVNTLNEYWETIGKTMQFIHQYDLYLLNNITLEIYLKAKNENLSKEQITELLTRLFGNIKHIIPIIKKMSDCLHSNINKLKSYDIENALEREDWVNALKAVEQKDIATEVHYERILSIINKTYPEL